jgi:trk system potassium uptake protein TrkA
LAKAIEGKCEVKIIEYSKTGAERLAAELGKTLVLQGDVTDEELLESENIGEMDVYCALTNDDENNIMSALLAKRMGVRKVVALINRTSYINLLQEGRIDIAISPAQATIGTLLARVRRGDVAAVHSLRRGAAEALELVAHGDSKSSQVVGRRVEEIDLPKGTTIGAIVRRGKANSEDKVIIAHHDTMIEAEDHVIVFVVNKRMVSRVEKLFQVEARFF